MEPAAQLSSTWLLEPSHGRMIIIRGFSNCDEKHEYYNERLHKRRSSTSYLCSRRRQAGSSTPHTRCRLPTRIPPSEVCCVHRVLSQTAAPATIQDRGRYDT